MGFGPCNCVIVYCSCNLFDPPLKPLYNLFLSVIFCLMISCLMMNYYFII